MDLKLKSKTALVLGGTRGIGRAIADTFAAEGANVAICARNEAQVSEAVAALESAGAKAFGASVDIADGAAVEAFVASAAKHFGGLNIVVSNASALNQGNTDKEWLDMLKIDVLGLNHLVTAALPHLEEAARKVGDAAIVSISSVSAVNGSQPAAYGAMKAALIHVMKGYARTLAAKKVRANVVSPGTVYFKGGVWNWIEENAPDHFKAAIARNPTGRMATPQEIADAAVFLASPRSAFTTGANLIVDGTITDRVNY